MLPERYHSLAQAHPANFVPLTPLSFLGRTAAVYGHRTSLIYSDRHYTWSETQSRVQACARALRALGLSAHGTVSVLAFNTPETFEAHYAVPLAGGVLNTINTRLDADTIAYILEFAECEILLVDRELLAVALPGLRALAALGRPAKVVLIDDALAATQPDIPADLDLAYWEVLIRAHAEGAPLPYSVENELAPLSINFTSGTSGRPKGVVYHHRGAHLMALGTIAGWALPLHPHYLYTVPLFHCNGWCHAWAMTVMAATIVCTRAVVPAQVFQLLASHDISHMGGAPIVLNMLANEDSRPQQLNPQRTVQVMTAGAPPPAAVLARMEAMGAQIMHVYGLTETYGHVLQCAPQTQWQEHDAEHIAELKSRQGVRFPGVHAARVVDSDGHDVPADGQSIGEIVICGNTVMSGYLKSPEATAEALSEQGFRSGDLAVVQADGYIQIKDRDKDIIISGGENISSVEIENALYKHPAVGDAAVVAMPHEKWGETPCAFVELKGGADTSEAELIEHCLTHLARFKKPSKVIFGALPKTATGKIQKYVLRQRLL